MRDESVGGAYDLPWYHYGTKITNISTAEEAVRALPQHAVAEEKDYFSFFDPIVKQHLASYDCIGIADRGRALWLTARLPGDYEITSEHAITQILFITSSIDNSRSAQVRCKPFELSTKTTLNDSLLYPVVRILDEDSHSIFEEGPDEAFRKISSHFDELARLFRTMAGCKLSAIDQRSFLETVFPMCGPTNIPKLKEAAAERDHDFSQCLFYLSSEEESRKTKSKLTLWDAYRGINQYLDHQKYRLGDEAWLNHAMSHPIKAKAFGAAKNWLKNTR